MTEHIIAFFKNPEFIFSACVLFVISMIAALVGCILTLIEWWRNKR